MRRAKARCSIGVKRLCLQAGRALRLSAMVGRAIGAEGLRRNGGKFGVARDNAQNYQHSFSGFVRSFLRPDAPPSFPREFVANRMSPRAEYNRHDKNTFDMSTMPGLRGLIAVARDSKEGNCLRPRSLCVIPTVGD